MNSEKNGKNLTQWLLAATIALLALVLGLQLWQMFGAPKDSGPPPAQDAAGPENSLSSGKAAMIEDVLALNGSLSAAGLAELSAQELEQLYETGAPGLPIGGPAAARAAGEYAGTLAVDSVTSETDPELDEAPAHYEVELHHPALGDFEYKVDAYTGQVLEGTPDILRSLQAADAPQAVPESDGGQAPASGTQTPAAQAPASGAQAPAAQAPASGAQTPAAQAPASGGQTPAAQAPAQQAPASGEEAAKQAAFAHAGVSADGVTVTKCKLDWDDGRQVYEIEFRADGVEYDYEIDASSCAVLKAGQEWGDHRHGGESAPRQQTGSFIGEEAAKSAALTHAGVSADGAGYIRCELDEDDGLWIYEVEFQAGNVEYDYKISASDGTVLKAEQDR